MFQTKTAAWHTILKLLTAKKHQNKKICQAICAALIAYSCSFWFSALKNVDPVYHKLYFYPNHPTILLLLSTLLACLLFFLFRKFKTAPDTAGIICACAGIILSFFPTFTAMAAGLVCSSLAIWRAFASVKIKLRSGREWMLVPGLLFLYIFAVGFEQQYSAYNKLMLYTDWGYYFDGYMKLAQDPFGAIGRWGSIGNHWNPAVNILMTIIVACFPYAATVFAMNSLVLASTAPLIFLLGKTMRLPDWLCAVCSIAAALNPLLSNQHITLFYGYHPIVFLIPAALLFMISKVKHNTPGMVLTVIFMCGIKETVFVFLFGAALFYACRKQWKKAGIIAASSVGMFLLTVKVLLPHCDGTGTFFQMFQYSGVGSSLTDILLSPVTAPSMFWSKLFRPGNASFLMLLMLPFLPAALFAPAALLGALPLLGGVLIKNAFQDKLSIVQQYGVEITVWLLIAMMLGSVWLYRRRKVSAGLAAALLFGSLSGYWFVGKTPAFAPYSFESIRKYPDITRIRKNMQNIIPPEAAVAAPKRWFPQLLETHRNMIDGHEVPDADFRIFDFSISDARESMMRMRDKLLKEQTEYPIAMFNSNGCSIIVFRKGKQKWHLPFILAGTPEKILPRGFVVPITEPGIRARAAVNPQQKKLLLFFAAEKNYQKDVFLTVKITNGNAQQFFRFNWGMGLYPAYAMQPGQTFAAALPIPANWQKIESLNIKTETFSKPAQKKDHKK